MRNERKEEPEVVTKAEVENWESVGRRKTACIIIQPE